jgi:DNA-directed RNA polymerase specialized sigma24 family protein
MPRIPGTTNAQTTFLRAFRSNPAGPPPADWPTPSLLRRWLRRPAFCRALDSLQRAHRFRADFLLTTAATHAAERLNDQAGALADDPRRLAELLRLAHVRHRFADTPATPAAPPADAFPEPETVEEFSPEFANALLADPNRLEAMFYLWRSHGDHRYDRFLEEPANDGVENHPDLTPPTP